jgi:hypothetical protein
MKRTNEQDAGRQLYDEMIGGRFGGSKFISEKMAIPAEYASARFGQNFKIEDGKVVAYDGQGNKVSSAPSPASWLASMKRWNSGRAIPAERPHPQSVRQQGGGSHQSQHRPGRKP